MPLTEQDHQFIERYVAGRLDAAEQEAFNERFEDPEVQREIAFQKDLLAAAAQVGKEDLKSDLVALEQRLQQVPAKRRQIPAWWAAAAGVLLVGIVYFIVRPGASSADALYAEYFTPIPNIVAPIDKSDAQDESTYNEAFRRYELGDYASALSLFDQLDDTDPHVQYFTGVTQMHLGEMTTAEEQLSTILADPDHPYQQQAQWYMALLHLKMEEKTAAVTLLQIIADQAGHPFREEAERVLGIVH